MLQKSIASKLPGKKFRNEQIDHSNKEDEYASNVCNTRGVSLAGSCDVTYSKTENICPTPSKQKVRKTGDSMLNGISEEGLSRADNLKMVSNFPGGTSDKIVEKFNDLIKNKPDDLVINI